MYFITAGVGNTLRIINKKIAQTMTEIPVQMTILITILYERNRKNDNFPRKKAKYFLV